MVDLRSNQNRNAFLFITAAIALLFVTVKAQVPTKFDFGTGAAAAGYTKVTPTTTYSTALGYGFENGTVTAVSRGGSDVLRGDYCTGTSFDFSVTLPQAIIWSLCTSAILMVHPPPLFGGSSAGSLSTGLDHIGANSYQNVCHCAAGA